MPEFKMNKKFFRPMLKTGFSVTIEHLCCFAFFLNQARSSANN